MNTDDSVLDECVGTWELADDVLTLDITSTLPSGAKYSYIAELTKAAEEEPAAAEEPAAGAPGPEEGIPWGMTLEEVKAVKQAQQKSPRRLHVSEDTEGGRPVLYCTVVSDFEDGEPVVNAYFFDTESGGLIFAYYTFFEPIADIYANLLTEYNGAYMTGDSTDAGKLYTLLADLCPGEELPADSMISSWKDNAGAGIWSVCSPGIGVLVVYHASPELTESVK